MMWEPRQKSKPPDHVDLGQVVSLALPAEPIPAVTSPTLLASHTSYTELRRRAAVEADAKVVRERRLRRHLEADFQACRS